MGKLMGFIKENKSNFKYAISIAWPAMLDAFFVAVVAMVDSFMVSQLGTNAVASIGLTIQPKFIGLAIFIAISTAVSASVARRKGEGDQRAANETMVTAMFISMIAVVFVSIIAVCFADPIIKFIGSEPETHDDAVLYLQIIMGALIFTIVSWIINAAQKGSGKTKLSMRTNIVSNIVNVIFNYLLISGHCGFPALGVKGAAIATVMGTMAACVMSISSLFHKDSYLTISYIMKEKVRATKERAITIYKFASNVFLDQMVQRVGFLLSAMITAGLGTVALAVNQVAGNALAISFSFGDGLQVAAIALIGQSLGEGRSDKAIKYGTICQTIGVAISVFLAIVFLLCGETFFQVFFPYDEEAVALGCTVVFIIIPIVLFQISQVIYMGSLRAAGDVKFIAVVSTITVGIGRPLISYVLAYVCGWGLIGVFMGILAEQVIKLGLTTWRFRSGKWMNIKI